MTEEMSIPQYFAGKNIFVTGATGFIGKALVEKLLRSCPDAKKGSSPWQRVKAITDAPVNIVYHVAASVRFDDSLKDAVIMNTRGTREVVELCKKMKRLDVLLYYSTMYCNTDRLVVDAQIYPSIADWRETIELVEKADPYVLQALEQKYIHPLPNTYTFSKQLAEHVVNDLCDGQIPVVIGRPSIVVISVRIVRNSYERKLQVTLNEDKL
ncbi:hypothetical protein NQ318_002182 [Aromia moschata]|uniref:Fatty acyl-CoA reductase n=1 Tax=Aromia moschata TaxID=1265417 RepID=A0AAV8Z2U9_9CUCU|nr:hypothetical protein NQ318_002182 [Aromia moschata]